MSFNSVFVVSNALRLRFFKTEYDNEMKTKEKDVGQADCNVEALDFKYNIKSKIQEGSNIMKKKLIIDGMMCQNCVKHVTKALTELEGVFDVTVSLEEKSAEITVTEKITDDTLKRAIADAGYELFRIEDL